MGDIRNFFTPREDQSEGGNLPLTTSAKRRNRNRSNKSQVKEPWITVQPKRVKRKSEQQTGTKENNSSVNMKSQSFEQAINTLLCEWLESKNAESEVLNKQVTRMNAISDRIKNIQQLRRTMKQKEEKEINSEDEEEGQSEKEIPPNMAIPFNKNAERENSAEDKDNQQPDSNEQNPQSINLSTVMLMFKEIKNEIAKTNTERQKEERAIKQMQKTEIKKVHELELEMEQSKIRNEILVDVVKHVEQELEEVKSKVDVLEDYSSRKSIVLTNYYCKSYRKKFYIGELERFLNSVLEDAYPIGEGSPRQMVITLETLNDKIEILQNKNRLKGQWNRDEKEYFITERLPAA